MSKYQFLDRRVPIVKTVLYAVKHALLIWAYSTITI